MASYEFSENEIIEKILTRWHHAANEWAMPNMPPEQRAKFIEELKYRNMYTKGMARELVDLLKDELENAYQKGLTDCGK